MTSDRSDAPRDRRGRARRILEILDRLHPDVDPFLAHESPFQLLVAVMLSAQCTDARVNAVTPALFARARDAHAMAALPPDELEPYIRTCGLAPSKARNIIATSRLLVERHGGQVPNDLAALEQLPGVGHKTACVVLSQAYRAEVFPVDTHIHRLAGRWQLSRARTVEEVERDLMAVFPRERWGTLHLQLIEFGRAHCTAKQHVPARCPICSWAMSKARARAEQRHGRSKPNLPPRRRK
jgi:endonuclease III